MNKKASITIFLTTFAIVLAMIAQSVNPTKASAYGLISSLLFFSFLCWYYTRNR